MATRVNITSLQAIEDFRASLIVYITKAKPTLEEISSEVVRTRVWVQNTQRVHWEGLKSRRKKAVEEAQNAVFSAKLSSLRKPSSVDVMNLMKAKRALEEAEAKLVVLRKWDRDYENQTEPMVRQLEKMYIVLSGDLVKAVTHLSQILSTLHAYAGMAAPSVVTEGSETAKTGEGLESAAETPAGEGGDV